MSITVPPYERCLKLPTRSVKYTTGEHVVLENDVSFDGAMYSGWCKFCGELVYARTSRDHWHPYRFHIIEEEPF